MAVRIICFAVVAVVSVVCGKWWFQKGPGKWWYAAYVNLVLLALFWILFILLPL